MMPYTLTARARRMVSASLAAACLTLATACDTSQLLEVEDPDVATPGSLTTPQALPVLRAAAIADFQSAFNGNNNTTAALQNEGIVTYGGMFADELLNAETFPTRIEIDQRGGAAGIALDNAPLRDNFRHLQRARATADLAADAFRTHSPDDVGLAEVLNLSAFTLVLLAEHYCSGVPLSRLTASGAPEYGQPLTTQELLQRAIEKFDSAATIATAAGTATGASAQLNLAKVGKARALLNLNQPTQAVTALAGVPAAFEYRIFHSATTARQNNGLFAYIYLGRRWTISDREGVNGLPFRSEGEQRSATGAVVTPGDTRVRWERGTGGLAFGFDGTTSLFLPRSHSGRDSSIVLASGVEALLIEAEAALRAGDGASMIAKLNAARAQRGVAATLTDPGAEAARVDLLFKERAFALFLTGHRLGDLRRLVRQYARPQGSVFPTGPYGFDPATPRGANAGGAYGTEVNLPVPSDEENNPNFTGCLDRNA
ncbi:MAG TPA: RagB/SusD family nutrient uptake outer membrane protein [Gemmatimonadaceae bacterium]|nr:RagB/SusD family nutrient uptake outer membrane protein [Gemmatimonadaceae bacterium]